MTLLLIFGGSSTPVLTGPQPVLRATTTGGQPTITTSGGQNTLTTRGGQPNSTTQGPTG